MGSTEPVGGLLRALALPGSYAAAGRADGGVLQRCTRYASTLTTCLTVALAGLLDQYGDRGQGGGAGNPSPWLQILVTLGPLLVLGGIFLWLRRRRQGDVSANTAGAAELGRSRARVYDAERPETTFADVAGIDDAKGELEEVVDFLREPDRYRRLGGMVPKGVLLVGEPGTGKTLLARAVAGEASVAFFSANASEFVEMVVGVGASRARDLFERARLAAPAIVFIDEIDAIGRQRSGAVPLSGHNEQEQTLNQILAEMDGFDTAEGVIVLAATNRGDVLDGALLRPGRFDRQVMVQPPDRRGRAEILRIHSRRVPLAPDVALEGLASATPGLVGSDLRNLVNEAALIAARRHREMVEASDFDDALTKVMLGAERRLVMTRRERERIAYHEAGHALLGLLLPDADPVRSVSIIPRGRSLGATVQSPVDERFNYAEEELRARIVGALGGRTAEVLVYGNVSTGAEDDVQAVTRIARSMVTRWGMSPELGPLDYREERTGEPLGQNPFSPETRRLIDAEARRIVDESAELGHRLLRDHRAALDRLAAALLREETLDGEAVRREAGLGPEMQAAG
ncbi:MAG: ATP-dependent zinc metalloprotease FtsH [Candidatus Dormibacteraeota bacterium]|nr:ATP-dependent zinc metalloprotease FtsH [Candidatus Dormibacteraeota bacterium]MBO0759853.1 ATP-dependent zinc metalloprotease FtsH [Candidatus Dormibacteraeota bacterium]